MEENKEMLALMEQLNEQSRKQVRFAKIQCVLTLISTVCFFGIFLLVLRFLPQITAMLGQLEQVMTQLPEMVSQLEVVLGNLEQVTTDLADIDFANMIENVNQLVLTGQTSLVETLQKLDTIDLEALNKAIENLAAVIEPMAKFFKVFK